MKKGGFIPSIITKLPYEYKISNQAFLSSQIACEMQNERIEFKMLLFYNYPILKQHV